jgi:hypothetical protein
VGLEEFEHEEFSFSEPRLDVSSAPNDENIQLFEGDIDLCYEFIIQVFHCRPTIQ